MVGSFSLSIIKDKFLSAGFNNSINERDSVNKGRICCFLDLTLWLIRSHIYHDNASRCGDKHHGR